MTDKELINEYKVQFEAALLAPHSTRFCEADHNYVFTRGIPTHMNMTCTRPANHTGVHVFITPLEYIGSPTLFVRWHNDYQPLPNLLLP